MSLSLHVNSYNACGADAWNSGQPFRACERRQFLDNFGGSKNNSHANDTNGNSNNWLLFGGNLSLRGAWQDKRTISGSPANLELDFTALPATNLSQPQGGRRFPTSGNMTGMRPCFLQIATNIGTTNTLSNNGVFRVGPGSSNGYDIFGSGNDIVFPKYAALGMSTPIAQLPDIDSSNKTIRIGCDSNNGTFSVWISLLFAVDANPFI